MQEDQNRRKYPRYDAPICYRPASLFSARKPLVNISLGGIRIYSDDEFKIGKRLEIELILADDSVLTCTAKVVWQRPADEDTPAKYDTGLQFLDISGEHLERLSEALENQRTLQ
jgi:c-di-GMP-binding flagellar brake protein YcgR